MATIELNTKQVSQRIVIAYDPIGNKPSRKSGDVEVNTGEVLEWQCANESQSFLVCFYRFDTGESTWPFSQPPDKSDPGPNPIRYLRVNSKNAKKVNVISPWTVTYAVTVETGPPAEPLDPMIIIRPQSFLALNLAFGVTCAVLGAAAGALLTAWLL